MRFSQKVYDKLYPRPKAPVKAPETPVETFTPSTDQAEDPETPIPDPEEVVVIDPDPEPDEPGDEEGGNL